MPTASEIEITAEFDSGPLGGVLSATGGVRVRGR